MAPPEERKRLKFNRLEQLVQPTDDLNEIEVDPDVFYDYFLSVPSVQSKRQINDLKEGYIERLRTVEPHELAPVLHGAKYGDGTPEKKKQILDDIQAARTNLIEYDRLKKQSLVHKLEKPDQAVFKKTSQIVTKNLTDYIKRQVRIFGV